ncbi:MAG: hypothetical protein NVS3B3_15720 [Aquirhabdus sp.]
MPHAYAYFRIHAENLPIHEITESIGIAPTKFWQKGDPGIHVPLRRDSGWCLAHYLKRIPILAST